MSRCTAGGITTPKHVTVSVETSCNKARGTHAVTLLVTPDKILQHAVSHRNKFPISPSNGKAFLVSDSQDSAYTMVIRAVRGGSNKLLERRSDEHHKVRPTLNRSAVGSKHLWPPNFSGTMWMRKRIRSFSVTFQDTIPDSARTYRSFARVDFSVVPSFSTAFRDRSPWYLESIMRGVRSSNQSEL